MPGRAFAPQRGLLHGQVRQDASCAACLGQLAAEALGAVFVDRVPVRHDQDWLAGGLVCLPHGADDAGDPDAAAQGDVAGGLDYRAVEYRVAVRQADLDDVGSAVQHRLDRGDALVDGRKAGCHVRDERGPVLLLRPGQCAGQKLQVSAHFRAPPALAASASCSKYRVAVSMSLSPRPDRFTRISPSGPSSMPTSTAPASAWALATDGMMSSVDASSRKARIAPASLTGRYSERPAS